MYYENFERLLKERNMKAADVCRGTGLKSSALSQWKHGEYTPKIDKLRLIADFFGVPVTDITGEEIIPEGFSEQEAHLLQKIRQDRALSDALAKYFELSDVKKKHIIDSINLLSE